MSNLVSEESEFVLYTNEDGDVKVKGLKEDGNTWITKKTMTEVFELGESVIGKHLNDIFSEGELQEASAIKGFLTKNPEGEKHITKYYNLDAIISVGYRADSPKAIQFRKWAGKLLREYAAKGFILDDERLKQGGDDLPDWL